MMDCDFCHCNKLNSLLCAALGFLDLVLVYVFNINMNVVYFLNDVAA